MSIGRKKFNMDPKKVSSLHHGSSSHPPLAPGGNQVNDSVVWGRVCVCLGDGWRQVALIETGECRFHPTHTPSGTVSPFMTTEIPLNQTRVNISRPPKSGPFDPRRWQ